MDPFIKPIRSNWFLEIGVKDSVGAGPKIDESRNNKDYISVLIVTISMHFKCFI